MLVLTRRPSEKIVIGKDGEIEFEVLRIDGNQVRLGFTASKEIPIHRKEVFLRIKSEETTEG